MERDRCWGNIDFGIKISTHTLTWSVTELVDTKDLKSFDFNSHAHVERDKYYLLLYLFVHHFNSHAHVERDLSYSMLS